MSTARRWPRSVLRTTALASAVTLLLLLPLAPAHAGESPPVWAVAASSHDGNVPRNTLDRSYSTRWSAEGDNEWIRYDMGAPKRLTRIAISFYRGNERKARFDLQVSDNASSWRTVLSGAESSGTTTGLEIFDFPDTTARHVRYVGHGNTMNMWNSLTRVEIFPRTAVKSGVHAAVASAHDGNTPRHAVDSNLGTRWSAKGDGQWLRLDLRSRQLIAYVKIAFFRGDERRARFDVQVSDDASSWRTVLSGAESSGTTTELETFNVPDTTARYVRYVGHGNTDNTWNSLTEFEVHIVSYLNPRVYPGDDGKLAYAPYANGDRIPDFSRAGYRGAGVALPHVPARRTVSPVSGDDRANIQAAIDYVSGLAPDAEGRRGAVLLRAGTYQVSGSLRIGASGVVLRGEGDGSGGTRIQATGTSQRDLIIVNGASDRSEVSGSRRPITDSYVPVGTRSLSVSDASGFAVGDDVIVERTPNQEWIDAIGMDACGTKGTTYDTSDVSGVTCIDESKGNHPWTPSSRIMRYERTITAISGDQLVLDSPTPEAIQSEFGGGAVYKYVFPGRISEVGVEKIRAESSHTSDTDEAHASRMISMSNVENAWVRDVTSRYFIQGTIWVRPGARHVTVQDSSSQDLKSEIRGNRRYPFYVVGASHVLMMRNYSTTGRHDYATSANTPGPNVFLDSRAVISKSELGPHHRWATGSLYDNIVHNSSSGSAKMAAYNRGNFGTGHGWSGAYHVFYNCVGDTHKLHSPPHARNWSIGCRAAKLESDRHVFAYGSPVAPWSLYLQQLKDRLGEQALRNIGY